MDDFTQSSHDKKPLSSVARCRRLRLILPQILETKAVETRVVP